MSPEAYLLADAHGGLWKESDKYPLSDWQYAVANDDTRLGYWDFVLQQMEVQGDIEPRNPDQNEVPNDE